MTQTDKEKLEAIDYLMGTMISLGMVSSLKEQDPEFGEMLEQIAKISILLNPIIPKVTSKVLEALKINPKSTNLSFLDGKDLLSKEISVNDLSILFKKIN